MSQQLVFTPPSGDPITFPTTVGSTYKFLRPYSGFAKIPTSHQVIRSPYLDVAFPETTRINERYVSFGIRISATTLPLLEAAILALTEALNPKLGTGVLTYTQEGGAVYALDCLANNTPDLSLNSRGRTWQDATIDLVAFNPFWYDPVPVTVVLATFTGGFTFPLTSPYTLGTASEETTIDNPGSVASPFTLVIYGEVVDPVITFTTIKDGVTTVKTISATLTVAAGDTLTITTGPGAPVITKVTSGTATNGFQYMDSVSDLTTQIEPGENVLSFASSASIGATAYCTVTYYKQYIGV
jgi:hypothetical protein